MARLVNIVAEGECDYSQLDDYGEWSADVVGGPHHGHYVTIHEEKHNCGGYGQDVVCSCGATWWSRMDGCWQQGHQRPESGDASLAWMATPLSAWMDRAMA